MKTHPTDLVSLVPGLLSVAIALVALGGGLDADLLAAEWLWPTVLIGLGLLVLATAGMGRRRDAVAEPSAVDEPEDVPPDADAASEAAWPEPGTEHGPEA